MTATASSPTATIPRRLFDVHEFHRMAEIGIFGETERVELVEGEIIQISPIGGPHIMGVARLNRMLVPLVAEHGLVSPQSSLHISERTELIPDFVVLKNKTYDDVPVPSDALLVIEVADRSLSRDLSWKASIYARAGVQEYWVWNVTRHVVHQFATPVEDRFEVHRQLKRGETITSVMLPTVSFEVDDISR